MASFLVAVWWLGAPMALASQATPSGPGASESPPILEESPEATETPELPPPRRRRAIGSGEPVTPEAPVPSTPEPAKPAPSTPNPTGTDSSASEVALRPPMAQRRLQVFLVPVGSVLPDEVEKVRGVVEREAAGSEGYGLVDLEAELVSSPSLDDAAKVELARPLLTEGDAAVAGGRYGDAATAYRKAIRLLAAAGNGLSVVDYAGAWARLGIALHVAGEAGPARDALSTAARIDAAGLVDGRTIDARQGGVLDEARQALEAAPKGRLTVKSKPSGARVLVGGVPRGNAPLTIESLPACTQLVRIERPGAAPNTQLVDVPAGTEASVNVGLERTAEVKALDEALADAPSAFDREKEIPVSLGAVGASLRLDRAVIATVARATSGGVGVRVAVLDFKAGRRVADRSEAFDLSSLAGESELATWVRPLIDAVATPVARSSAVKEAAAPAKKGKASVKRKLPDPDEEFERSVVPAGTRKKGIRSKDPLDHLDGTEEW